jgi:hypothetical protein
MVIIKLDTSRRKTTAETTQHLWMEKYALERSMRHWRSQRGN